MWMFFHTFESLFAQRRRNAMNLRRRIRWVCLVCSADEIIKVSRWKINEMSIKMWMFDGVVRLTRVWGNTSGLMRLLVCTGLDSSFRLVVDILLRILVGFRISQHILFCYVTISYRFAQFSSVNSHCLHDQHLLSRNPKLSNLIINFNSPWKLLQSSIMLKPSITEFSFRHSLQCFTNTFVGSLLCYCCTASLSRNYDAVKIEWKTVETWVRSNHLVLSWLLALLEVGERQGEQK